MNVRELFRKVESHLNAIENQPSLALTLGLIIESILKDFSVEFGFTGARLYILDGAMSEFKLEAKFGVGTPAPIGFALSQSYPPVQSVCRNGIIYMDLETQGVDPALEAQLGVKRFAAITVGAENLSMVAFTIDPERDVSRDSVLFALSSIRHSINLKLAKEKLESIILQSREIQLSLLPDEDVSFPGYDIYGRSQPAELVGGDVYDFIQISPKIFGIAIGDATGHGLPAALQARDVVIGLRMGISEDQKMVKVLERLNKVIHGSRLTSRFVSLWYGELEPSGHLIYSNAGHVPPFYYRKKKDRFYPMSEGGMVLGPSSESVYRRGFFKIEPGDAVILYTDGITEAANKAGEQFGEERLLEFVRGHLGTLTAQQMVDGLMDAVAEFSSRGPYQDDRTVVFLRRVD